MYETDVGGDAWNDDEMDGGDGEYEVVGDGSDVNILLYNFSNNLPNSFLNKVASYIFSSYRIQIFCRKYTIGGGVVCR